MNVILGAGEVAIALSANLRQDLEMYDKGEWEDLSPRKTNFLHICIPYSDNFIDIVNKAITIMLPKYTVIHSSVKIGTTTQIKDACYSPILGRHSDNFVENMGLYIKPFCGSDEALNDFTLDYSLPVEKWGDSIDSLEFAKVMSTGYMYWNLIYQKVVYNICKERNYDFNLVYTDWNKLYNNGIKEKHPEWQRPVYQYDNSGHIPGGHCLNNNIYLDDNFINDILKEWQEKGNIQILKIIKKP